MCGDFHVSFDEREKAFLFIMYERLGNLMKAAHWQNEQLNGMKKERRG